MAQAQTSLTIDEAIALGVERAPRIAEARARAAAAGAAVTARQTLTHPVVSASAGLLRTNHVDEFGIPQQDGSTRVIFPDIPSNYRLRAEVAVPVYTAGRAGAHVASAQADREATDADIRAVRADVELEIVTAYWTLVMARERVAVLERAGVRADAVVADVEARVDAGLLPPNEVLSAQAQRARQRVLRIQAANDASLAEVELARLVGAQPGERLELSTPVTRPTPGVEALRQQPAADLTRQATSARSERLALAWRQRALRASADASFAATRPQSGWSQRLNPRGRTSGSSRAPIAGTRPGIWVLASRGLFGMADAAGPIGR